MTTILSTLVKQGGRFTRLAGQQGWQATKAGRPPRLAGKQGGQANKAGKQKRQAGQQGRQVWPINVPALTANIFAAATYRTNIHNKKVVRAINQSMF